jgi:hypothetical protein
VPRFLFFFLPCVGSDKLFDKLWLVLLLCAAWQCVWLFSVDIIVIFSVVTFYEGQLELFSDLALEHQDFFLVSVMVLTFCEVLLELYFCHCSKF